MLNQKMASSMIKLMESEKFMIEYITSLPVEQRMDVIKEWGLASILILTGLKSVLSSGNSQEAMDEELSKISDDIDTTIIQVRATMGYNGPIGQA
jgi:hypothetical protein